MNNIEDIVIIPYLVLIIESISFYIYLKISRRLIKTLVDSNQAFQTAGRQMYAELEILKDQFRILTKVNTFLKGPTKKIK